jgi:hypothetical protein
LALQDTVAALREELATTNARHESAARRAKDRITQLTERNGELEEEIRALEQLRLDAWDQVALQVPEPSSSASTGPPGASKGAAPSTAPATIPAISKTPSTLTAVSQLTAGPAPAAASHAISSTDISAKSAPPPKSSDKQAPPTLTNSGSSSNPSPAAPATIVKLGNGAVKETHTDGTDVIHFPNGDVLEKMASGEVRIFSCFIQPTTDY